MCSKVVIHVTFNVSVLQLLNNQINHKAFSMCFLSSFKFFLRPLCTSLVPLIFPYSAQIDFEINISDSARKCLFLPAECSPQKSLILLEIPPEDFIQTYVRPVL